MFSFFKKKPPPAPAPAESPTEESAAAPLTEAPVRAAPPPPSATEPVEGKPEKESADDQRVASAPMQEPEAAATAEPTKSSSGVFSFFRKKPPAAPASADRAAAPALPDAEPATVTASVPVPETEPATEPAPVIPAPVAKAPPVVAQIKAAPPTAPVALKPAEHPATPMPVVPTIANAVDKPVDKPMAPSDERKGWLERLKTGLKRTGAGITSVFTGTKIDDALYEELEEALLMADTGVKATEHLLTDLKRRVKEAKATDPAAVKGLLADAIVALLEPLQKTLVIGEYKPTVIMVAGVNGAGKTTSIGKLTRHLANEGASVLLAAADTFRAAAREQLAVWADRNTVEIVTQKGGDPAAVSFDAVTAGRSRGRDVVLVDTAGRLPTQLHLMEELKKIKRVVQKADPTGPHEVLLVIDGNTGQNALAQVKAFDDTLGLTGLVITKLDGTAKGGVICAIAREKPIPIYFIGVGEKLEDLETFNAREFAQALLS